MRQLLFLFSDFNLECNQLIDDLIKTFNKKKEYKINRNFEHIKDLDPNIYFITRTIDPRWEKNSNCMLKSALLEISQHRIMFLRYENHLYVEINGSLPIFSKVFNKKKYLELKLRKLCQTRSDLLSAIEYEIVKESDVQKIKRYFSSTPDYDLVQLYEKGMTFCKDRQLDEKLCLPKLKNSDYYFDHTSKENICSNEKYNELDCSEFIFDTKNNIIFQLVDDENMTIEDLFNYGAKKSDFRHKHVLALIKKKSKSYHSPNLLLFGLFNDLTKSEINFVNKKLN